MLHHMQGYALQVMPGYALQVMAGLYHVTHLCPSSRFLGRAGGGGDLLLGSFSGKAH